MPLIWFCDIQEAYKQSPPTGCEPTGGRLELGIGIHPKKIGSMTPTIRFYKMKITFALSVELKKCPNRRGTGWEPFLYPIYEYRRYKRRK
jgi:hypothetical protein